MTKEELEKEATEYAQKLGAKDFIAKPKEIVAYFGYLAAAEPREKRIAELEKRCANYEMTISKMEKGTCDICKETEKDKKIEELAEQIEKMKCCGNCKYGCIACGNYLCELLLNNCNSIPFHCDKWEIKENE